MQFTSFSGRIDSGIHALSQALDHSLTDPNAARLQHRCSTAAEARRARKRTRV